MFPFVRYVHLFSPSLQRVPWPLLSEALRFPTFTGTYGFIRLLIHPWTPTVSLGAHVSALASRDGELSWVPGESTWKHASS